MTPARRAKKPAQKAAYHHANLRRALLDAAIVYLRTGEVTRLTMQLLARAAGVSPGAPYHHFPDKESLLAALATEGYELWLERAKAALEESATARERLKRLAKEWLRFTAEHPSHFRVMFLPDVEDRLRFAGLHATSERGLRMLVGLTRELFPQLTLVAARARAVAILSTLHGFASLRDAGVLANLPDAPAMSTLEAATLELVLSKPE